MTKYHKAQDNVKLNSMSAEDVVVDISQKRFISSVQQRLFELTFGKALAEASPGVANNFQIKDIWQAFINKKISRPNDDEIDRVNEILQQSQLASETSGSSRAKSSDNGGCKVDSNGVLHPNNPGSTSKKNHQCKCDSSD